MIAPPRVFSDSPGWCVSAYVCVCWMYMRVRAKVLKRLAGECPLTNHVMSRDHVVAMTDSVEMGVGLVKDLLALGVVHIDEDRLSAIIVEDAEIDDCDKQIFEQRKGLLEEISGQLLIEPVRPSGVRVLVLSTSRVGWQNRVSFSSFYIFNCCGGEELVCMHCLLVLRRSRKALLQLWKLYNQPYNTLIDKKNKRHLENQKTIIQLLTLNFVLLDVCTPTLYERGEFGIGVRNSVLLENGIPGRAVNPHSLAGFTQIFAYTLFVRLSSTSRFTLTFIGPYLTLKFPKFLRQPCHA